MRRAFLRAVRDAQLLLPLEELIGVVESGNFAAMSEAIESVAPQLADAVQDAYSSAGLNSAIAIAAELGSLTRPTFDILNQRGVDALRANRLRLVSALGDDARSTALDVLQRGLVDGRRPDAIARDLRSSLGLTPKQAQFIENYRDELRRGSKRALNRALRDKRFDRSVLSVVTGRRGNLTEEQIDRMVEAYHRKWVAHRAGVVANTEALRAVNQGEAEAWQQAVERGDIAAEDVLQVWNTAADERVRSSHRAMNGQKREGVGEPFLSGAGNALRFPGDPAAPGSDTISCRCVVARTLRG